jgi:hypothetical protein
MDADLYNDKYTYLLPYYPERWEVVKPLLRDISKEDSLDKCIDILAEIYHQL